MSWGWPDACPTCGGAWGVRSKTMGAAKGQPHQGRCLNGHWWHEGTTHPAILNEQTTYTIEIKLTVTESGAQGDEQELFETHVHDTFGRHQWDLKATKVEIGPLVRHN